MTSYQERRVSLELIEIYSTINRNKVYNVDKTIYVVSKDFLSNIEFVEVLSEIKKALLENYLVSRVNVDSNNHYIFLIETKKEIL